MKNNLKNLLLILSTLLIFSCSKTEEKKEIPEEVIIATTISDFGGVLLGNEKNTSVTITNKTKSEIPLNLTIPDPFSLSSVSQTCIDRIVKPNQSCTISIKFIPVEEGLYEMEIPVRDKKIALKGVGLKDGYLVLNEYTWALGSFQAGQLKTKVFELTNMGDLSIRTPTFNLPSFMQIGLNRCGQFIASKASCQITIESRITSAGTHNGQIPYSSIGGGNGVISYTANVASDGASGLISFESIPDKMDSTGEEFIFISKPIKDQYGNVVPEGTRINLVLSSTLISLDGTSFLTNDQGIIQFRIRTVTQKGEGVISLNSGQASGYVSFPITAGDAFGTISVKPFTNNIPANGQTQTIINTETIFDQYNNIVEDGTEVIFEVVGDATVGTAASPKIRKTVAIGGTAFARITAGTVASNVVIKIYSGPIKNERDEIVGYKANGQVTLNLIPGPAFGTFDITSGVNAIYSNNNPPEGNSIPTQTTVSIGPIKDEFGNIVTLNTEVSLNIINGFNVSGVVPENQSIIRTDAFGRASFVLTGANQRGNIRVTATSAGATAFLDVWGYEKSRIKYDTTNNNVVFNMLHHDAKRLPLVNIPWDTIKDGVPMSTLDSNYYGFVKYSDRATTRFGMNDNFPFFNWDCSFTAGSYLVFNFCMQPDGNYSPLYKYTQNFSLLLDSPQVDELIEYISNGDFSAQKGLSFWNDFESVPAKATGVKYSSVYTGVMWIDNAIYVAPNDTTKKKKFAVSSPITVDPLKKYIILFTIKEMIGTTENSHLSFGYIKEPANGNPLDPNYNLGTPVIVQEDFDLSTVNIQQRLVFTPPTDATKIRLYFSTKGSGNSADVKLDDISMKELTTQNIHDLTSTDGVSVAYMPKWDQAVMFGGTTGIQQSPTSYSTVNSGQTTVLSRVLDTSIGVVLSKYPENSQTNIGEKPTPRGYMSMTSSDDTIYAYGGLTLGGEGSAKDEFFSWDGENLKWSKWAIASDPSISDPLELGLGKPGKRYQSGLLYIPELDNIYLMGGLRQDKDNETFWYSMDDLWKVKAKGTKQWTQLCSTCNFAPNGIFPNLAKSWSALTTTPNETNFSNYVYTARNLKSINSIWHSASQKAYFYIPESNYFAKFDPYTEAFENMEIAGIYDLRSSYLIDYNAELGRTFGYVRGELGSNMSRIFFWDMNRDEKQYVKVTFNLEEQAKTFIKELKINLYAYGESRTFRPEGTVIEAGVELFLFNYQTMNWEKVGQNNASNSVGAQTPISFLVNNFSVTEYVSVDGKVSAMVAPKGRPGFTGGDPKMGDSLGYVQLIDVTGDLAEFKEIVAGGQTTCGILKNDTVKCWGRNNAGQLGQGSATASIGESANEMASIGAVAIFNRNDPYYSNVTVSQMTVGGSHVCALLSNNELKCWGDNTDGKLGIGVAPVDSKVAYGDGVNEMSSNLPIVRLFNNPNYEILKVEAGANHTCALIKVANFGTMNKVKCWGNNSYGQLGTGNNTAYGASEATVGDNLPWVTGILSFYDDGLGANRQASVKDISVGANHTCAIVETRNGTDALQCWGRNNLGQLSLTGGDLSNKNIATSTSIQTIEIYKLKAGGDHSCMNFYDGSFDKFLCWGKNDYGQLGRGGGGIVSAELVKNGGFTSNLSDWNTIGVIAPNVVGGKLNMYGGGNGIRQSFTTLKIDQTYKFEMDISQIQQPAVFNLITSGLTWQRMSGAGTASGLSMTIGSQNSDSVSRIRSQEIKTNIEALRNYTYRFKIQDAQGSPYFKILDENFNIIYSSEKLNNGDYTFSFDLKGHQDSFYIDWYVDKYQTAKINTMEMYKNPHSSLPITVVFYKNIGFAWEAFDSVTADDTGTFRHEFIAPANNVQFEIITDPEVSNVEQVYVDNVSLRLKDELLVELPLDLDFEFLDFDDMNPRVVNEALLDELFVPKNFYPNFRALYQKMLNFESASQNRIELENFSVLNMGTQDFVFEMEIDPKGLGTRRPLLSKIALSPITGKITTTGGWIFYIDQNRRLSFYVDGTGVVGESTPIETGFQKIRVQRTTENGVNKIKFYKNIGLGWADITVNGNLSNGSVAPNLQGADLSKNTDAPLMIGSTFDDSTLEGEQRAYGHYEGLMGYIYMKVGADEINFIEGLLPDNNVLADFTDIGGAMLPDDFTLGDNHTCVLISGSVKCFGDNVGGQVGYGQGVDEYGISLEQMGFNLPDVNIGTGLQVKSITSGSEHNCVILMDDTSKCWGRNGAGQLGINSSESRGRGKDNVMGTNELKIDYIDLEGIF